MAGNKVQVTIIKDSESACPRRWQGRRQRPPSAGRQHIAGLTQKDRQLLPRTKDSKMLKKNIRMPKTII